MRILISNDDGINATGLERLERVAETLSDDVWVVAPETDQSGASHSLTLSTPVRLRRLSERRYAVAGTPTDSVLLAVLKVFDGKRPDLVLSGINRGGNLGEDVTYSGTVAAAMEATLLGIPAIALSQDTADRARTKWATAEHHAPAVIRRLLDVGWPPNVMMNVNFPDVPEESVAGVRITVQGRRKPGSTLDERVDPRGRPYFWINSARTDEPTVQGSDLMAIADGAISVTPLFLDLTHHQTCEAMRAVFS